MAHSGATTPRRLSGARRVARSKRPILVARAPWPEAVETPVRGRWPRAVGLTLAIVVSAGLWALLIWAICLLVR